MPQDVDDRTPTVPVDLAEVGARLLDEARRDSGHAAVSLAPGQHAPISQSLIALADGAALAPDRWNGPATLYVVDGAVVVSGIDDPVAAGRWAPVPHDASVTAAQDSVLLLTVVLPRP